MLSKRIIPCLDVRDGRTTKGIKFRNNVDIGDPVAMARFYYEAGADELVFYDITASSDRRNIMIDVVRRVAAEILIPFSVGGGIRNLNDMRDVLAQAAQGNAQAKLAVEVYVHQARHWVGAFFLELNGADALVFTAGIGENSAELRELICRNLDQLGLALNSAANAQVVHGQEAVISAPNSRVKILVIPTNEELVIAREARRFLLKTNLN